MGSKRIVIPGGSGFIGGFISRFFLGQGFEVVVLTRGKADLVDGVHYVQWDGVNLGDWSRYVDGAYAIINLTGRSINCRFTKRNKEEIIESRISSVRVLKEACRRAKVPPVVFIQTSSVGYYGDTRELCAEETPTGTDFLANVCRQWENAFWENPLSSTRMVGLRFGVVLYCKGGAMDRMLPWTRWYLGGRHGNGRQPISWIHLEDLARLFDFALTRDEVKGVFNATSDYPVSNAAFMTILRQVLKRPWAPPVPAFAVRLVAYLLMGTNADVLLHGAACTSKRILGLGFDFRFPSLPQALRNLLEKK